MSNGGEVLIRGQRAPVVGTVCMDVTMVDITNIGSVEVGDEVVLFGKDGGEEITVDDIARRGDTINYEILCRISARVRRIFVRGD
jgi:alanine racemase